MHTARCARLHSGVILSARSARFGDQRPCLKLPGMCVCSWFRSPLAYISSAARPQALDGDARPRASTSPRARPSRHGKSTHLLAKDTAPFSWRKLEPLALISSMTSSIGDGAHVRCPRTDLERRQWQWWRGKTKKMPTCCCDCTTSRALFD